MKRVLAFLAALIATSALAQVPIYTRPASASGIASITGGTIMGSPLRGGPEQTLSKAAITFVNTPSGTMGNNGAMTLGTALSRTLSDGAWYWMPAGSIAAGVPAALTWYWGVASSATAVTLFNSTYSTGQPARGTATPFVTTGPGAFTGDVTEAFGPTISLAANSLGLSGMLRGVVFTENNNSAGNKTTRVRWTGNAGTAFVNITRTTQTNLFDEWWVENEGATNAQIAYNKFLDSTGGVGSVFTPIGTMAVDSTTATTIVHGTIKAVATDWMILNFYQTNLIADGT